MLIKKVTKNPNPKKLSQLNSCDFSAGKGFLY